MRWTQTLAALPDDGFLVTGRDGRSVTERRVLLLTGQSSWRHSRLSPRQDALLTAVAAHGYHPVRSGFPYHCELLETPWPGPEPLPLASIRNAAQFRAARFDRQFRAQIARALQAQVDHTSEQVLVITGSSGLHLWVQARPALRIPRGLRVDLIALGPVMTPAPLPGGTDDLDTSLTVIQGRRDRFSQWGFRGAVDHVVEAGHLDYSGDPGVVALVTGLSAELSTRPHLQDPP
ncbi:MAG: hypothetical protein KBB39_13870 [Phycicoccus sp.]|nr:hypothetical protein [Phycicoccus sp.]